MPRRTRRYDETEASRALTAVVRKYDEAEAHLNQLGTDLKAAIVAVAREDNSITVAEIARRVGWSREYVSRVISDEGRKSNEVTE